MRNLIFIGSLCLLLLLGMTACAQDSESTATPTIAPVSPAGNTPENEPEPAGPTRTPVEIPTLYPTHTPPPLPTLLPNPTPAETATAETPVDLTTPVLSFRYVIPALGLERSVDANAGGRIVIRDEVTGREVIRNNQLSVVDEIQSALDQIVLDPVPEACPGCVQFSYNLPDTDQSALGWLRDPVLLASIENYTAANLGPHFPAGTVAGLRRGATPYDPAHSLAVTAEGLLWRWLANGDTVADPVPLNNYPSLAASVTELSSLNLDGLDERYAAECPLTPVEYMRLNPAGTSISGSDTATTTPVTQYDLTIVCPAFSLPGILVPLYVKFDTALAETLTVDPLSPPPLELPLDMMIDYQRADGARLTIRRNGQAVGQEPLGRTFTTTLPVSNVITLTTGMAATGRLVPGVEQYAEGEIPNLLLVRGPYQMWELAWQELTPPDLRPFIAQLDRQLDALIGLSPTPTITPTPGSGTPPAGNPTPSPTPES